MSSQSQPPGSGFAPVSGRVMTSSRLASFKDYVAQMDYYTALSSRVRGSRESGQRQTWDQWARQALWKPYGSSPSVPRVAVAVEKVQLFPGWAVRRPANPSRVNDDDVEFGLDVYISGFASSVRPPEAATRSQKAFYRLAKGYAALPKLPVVSSSQSTILQQGSMGVQRSDTPPRPPLKSLSSDNNIGQLEFETLEARFKEIMPSLSTSSSDDLEDDIATLHASSRSDSYPSTPTSSNPSTPTSSTTKSFPIPTLLPEQLVGPALERLHANLDSRLQPFWSNAIPNRMVHVSVYCPYPDPASSDGHDISQQRDHGIEPLANTCVTTDSQGAFQTIVKVPWIRLATHPPTLHVAFGDRDVEYPIIVQAEMWAPPPRSPSASFASPPPYAYQRNKPSGLHTHIPDIAESLAPSSTSPSRLVSPVPDPSVVRSNICMSLSRAHVPIRLISDIDDTVKHAGVLQGAKHVFRNVFVRHLEDLVVRSMVDWYRTLWQKGVRFHYVSNSPFELLPVLTEYFEISSLPEGSIKLKSYAARSLLPALLSPPAARKRQGVIDVLDAFPESRFLLVGDTGEQDLELYTELARERPHQVIGVFVRNVSTGHDHNVVSISARTGGGYDHADANFGLPLVDTEPEPIQSIPSTSSLNNLTSSRPDSSSTSGTTVTRPPLSPHSSRSSYSPRSPMLPSVLKSPRLLPRSKSLGGMSLEDKRRYDLELRIDRARAIIPSHTAFRVFREPDECVEVQSILDRFLNSHR